MVMSPIYWCNKWEFDRS